MANKGEGKKKRFFNAISRRDSSAAHATERKGKKEGPLSSRSMLMRTERGEKEGGGRISFAPVDLGEKEEVFPSELRQPRCLQVCCSTEEKEGGKKNGRLKHSPSCDMLHEETRTKGGKRKEEGKSFYFLFHRMPLHFGEKSDQKGGGGGGGEKEKRKASSFCLYLFAR